MKLVSRILLCAAVPLVFAGGCHKKGSASKKSAASAGAAGNAPATAPAKTPAKAGNMGNAANAPGAASGAPWKVDSAAAQAKLQGAWVVKSVSSLGDIQAWNVKGDQVTVFNGKKEATGKLVFDAPCELGIKESMGGGTQTETAHYVWDGDKLHIGLGGSGVKQGATVIACSFNGVYVSKGASCKYYTQGFSGQWKAKPATCSLKGGVFQASAGKYEKGTLKVHGNALATDQLWMNVASKASDYAAAKKQVAAVWKKRHKKK